MADDIVPQRPLNAPSIGSRRINKNKLIRAPARNPARAPTPTTPTTTTAAERDEAGLRQSIFQFTNPFSNVPIAPAHVVVGENDEGDVEIQHAPTPPQPPPHRRAVEYEVTPFTRDPSSPVLSPIPDYVVEQGEDAAALRVERQMRNIDSFFANRVELPTASTM